MKICMSTTITMATMIMKNMMAPLPLRDPYVKKLFQEEVDERVPRDNFYHCLVTAAHQFHNRQMRPGSKEHSDDHNKAV